MINPDCGLRHLPADVARAKLRAMVAGAALVREPTSCPAASRRPAAPPPSRTRPRSGTSRD